MKKWLFLFFMISVIGNTMISGTLKSKGTEATEKATFAGGYFWCMQHPLLGLASKRMPKEFGITAASRLVNR
jgi:hypothetical protein